MISRRSFVNAVGAGLSARRPWRGNAPARRRRLAVVTTEWRERSHAWHMGGTLPARLPKGRAMAPAPFLT